jgi:hypothetical protein
VFAADRLPHREHAAAPGTLSHGDARPVLRQFPDRQLTLDLDESFDRGEQQLRKFNAYYDDFLPIHIFDTRLVVSVLREAATPSDPGPGQAGGRPSARAVPPGPDPSARRQPLCLSGSDDPPIALRSGPEDTEARLCRGCEARGLEYIFGLAGTAPLAAQVQTLEARTGARYAARRAAEPPKFKLRRYMDFRGSPGTASAGSSPGSKPDPTGSTPAPSSPT